MPNISRTKTWNANETLTAADLNAEFDGLLNGINDNALDNDNLSQTDDYLFGSLVLGSGISAGGGDGKLHVHVASAGTITAHADANDVTIENSTNTGLTIFSGTTGTGNIHFGDSGDNDIGKISYDHNANDLIFTANAAEIFRYDQSDDQVEFSKPPTPVSDDGVALGASGTAFSDLFLASGGVINWNAGDVTLTHASNVITLGGGNLGIGSTTPASNVSGAPILEIEGSKPTLVFDDNADDNWELYTDAGAFYIYSPNDGNQLVFADAAAGITSNVDLFVANNKGLVVGHTAQVTSVSVVPEVQILGTGNEDTRTLVGRWSADAVGTRIDYLKSRNATIGSFTAVQDDDNIVLIRGVADDGADYTSVAAQIGIEIDGTPGANDTPGRIVLSTTADGAASPTEALRIDSGQKIYNRVDSTGYYTGASDDFHWHHNGTDNIIEGASNLRLQTDGVLVIENDGASAGVLTLIGDTANANMTIGLTINQGANDDQAIDLKSSDVATGLTTVTDVDVETDDFFNISKRSPTVGGARFQVLAEDAALSDPFQINCIGGTADTTKTTSGIGLVNIRVYEHDGSNGYSNITADGNVFTVTARVGGSNVARFLIDEDGDMYSVTAGQTFDYEDTAQTVERDDIAMLSAYDHAIAPDKVIRTEYEDFARYNEQALIDCGVLGAPVAEGGMTNVTQMQRLHNGAIRQLGRKQAELVALLDERDSKIAELESEITKIKGMLN